MNQPSSDLPESAIDARMALFEAMRDIAQQITVPSFRSGLVVDNKHESTGGFDPVTAADRDCETALRALIEQHFPHDGIFGEEHGQVRLDADFVWIIDPIDGTRAFVAGVPLWGMLVGLNYRGKPVAGQAFQPFIGEAFAGARHASATWVRGQTMRPISTRPCAALADAMLMTTTPALFNTAELAVFQQIEKAARSVRYGTDWYGYALIAAGTSDIVVEADLSPYDILPLVPIVEAAGGAVTDWTGKQLTDFGSTFTGQAIAVGDTNLLPQLIDMLAPAALK